VQVARAEIENPFKLRRHYAVPSVGKDLRAGQKACQWQGAAEFESAGIC
jgi:hypothetical protein